MKKMLRMIASIEPLFHFEAEEKKVGPCSGLSGDCSGLSGNCSGLSGDVDKCEITEEERERGVDIDDLVPVETQGAPAIEPATS